MTDSEGSTETYVKAPGGKIVKTIRSVRYLIAAFYSVAQGNTFLTAFLNSHLFLPAVHRSQIHVIPGHAVINAASFFSGH